MSTESTDQYRLIYWGSVPGRGEFARLAFEYAGHPYENVDDSKIVVGNMRNVSKSGFPPHFAPPMLQLPSGQTISQTANILVRCSGRESTLSMRLIEDSEIELPCTEVGPRWHARLVW